MRTPLCRAFGPKLPRRRGLTTLGEGPPRIFYAPRAPPRRRSRKFSRKFVKKSYFANFSDAPDARGHRELPVVKISALNDPWRYQKDQENEKKTRTRGTVTRKQKFQKANKWKQFKDEFRNTFSNEFSILFRTLRSARAYAKDKIK